MSYFTAKSNFVTWVFLWEKVKTVDFSETIAASDLKVGRCRQLIEFMNTGVNQKVLPVLSTETLLHIWLSTEYYGFRPSSTAVDTVS